MSLKDLPALSLKADRKHLAFEPSAKALEKWNVSAAGAADDADTISVFDVIGATWDGSGVTADRISAALNSIGDNPVTVSINSPGGDMFEGLAIYNILREHPAKVTVKVMGVAASAASIIAMAGDDVQMAKASFLMIHNCWVVAMGNADDLREVADTLEPFDAMMAGVYSDRTGLPVDQITAMLSDETWIDGATAVAQGFADNLLPADAAKKKTNAEIHDVPHAARRLDEILAKSGMPRSERRQLIRDLKSGTPSAADTGTPGAADTADQVRNAAAELALALALVKTTPITI